MKRTVPVYKNCPVCNASFPVCPPGKKSRLYPPNTQVFCSMNCARKSRYRHGSECAILTPTAAAYIAGFLDADGSVLLYRRRDAVALRVVFANCKPNVLEWIVEQAGAGSIVKKPIHNAKHATAFAAQFNADLAASLLKQVVQYMIIKASQAELAIDFQERLKNPAMKANRSWQYAFQEAMQSMNKRGPIHRQYT